jgi:dTDP-4-amino-4,6-dideoxygalactose transaminase
MIVDKEAKNSLTNNAIFLKNARSAILHVLNRNLDKILLIPAYFGLSNIEGSGTFDPVRESKIKYIFYPVSDKLIPDMQFIKNIIESPGRVEYLFFFVNYFGFIQVQSELINFLKKRKIKIIEDCAHTIFISSDVKNGPGSIGDYVVYSMHKHTSTNEGGVLVDNIGNLINCNINENLEIDKRDITIYFQQDLKSIEKIRIEYYDQLDSKLIENSRLYRKINFENKRIYPMNYPILVQEAKRNEFYWGLVNAGITPTSLYHRLIPEITVNNFPVSINISNQILNLPIHQGIPESKFSEYVDRVNSVIKNF